MHPNNQEALLDPQAAADSAELAYVSDSEPGIRRRRHGRGFIYIAPHDSRISDEATLERIRSLAIPPLWVDVWICADPAGHIQATGRDKAGRKQYRYHPAWLACRDEAKFASLADFARALPALRARVDEDLARRGMPRDRVVASVVWLLDHTMMRIGNDVYVRENRSFGLTTLESRHLEIDGPQLRFSFKGKSGKEWKVRLKDRRIANVVRSIQELPGQHLFQYIDAEGTRRPIHSDDVNGYIRDAIGAQFTSKHFRTWGATAAAALLLAGRELPGSKREATRVLNEVIDAVAAKLRNTRAICRRCYVHPAIVQAWLDGRLGPDLRDIRKRYPKPFKGLDHGESTLLRWLTAHEGQ